MSTFALLAAGLLWGQIPQQPARAAGPAALTLRQAIGEALAASPALEPSQDAVEIAQINEQLQRSEFGLRISPALHFGTQQNGFRQHQAMLTASRTLPTGTELAVIGDWMQFGAGPAADRDAGVTFRVSQSLLQAFGPAPRAGLAMASRAARSATRAHEEARRDLIIRTAAAYFAIVRQQLLLEAAGQARVRAGRLREAAAARSRAGLGTELDVMRADLMMGQADAALASAREAVERARDDLKMLLGRPVDSHLAIDIADVPDATAAAEPDRAPDDAAIERRFDVAEARARVEDAEKLAALTRWAALPDVQLNLSYSRRGLGRDAPSLVNEWLGGWRMGISTTYGLQGKAADAAAAGARVGLRAAEREAQARAQAATADVRATRRAVTRTAGAIDLQRKTIEIAERQARLAGLRYERGLADNVDLIDAELHLLHARTALIAARVDHALARLALARATGTLDPDSYRP
jgi:outer membrane protein TolC